MTNTKSKPKTKTHIAREARISEEELAIARSEYYRGYHLEDTGDGTKFAVIIRRLDQPRTKKSEPVIYRIDARESIEEAKKVIDKTAMKLNMDITEVNSPTTNTKIEKASNNSTPKRTSTSQKTQQKASSAPNLNTILREKGLWQKGMQFLTSEEKQRFIDGDKTVQKVLDNKLKAIAKKAAEQARSAK